MMAGGELSTGGVPRLHLGEDIIWGGGYVEGSIVHSFISTVFLEHIHV